MNSILESSNPYHLPSTWGSECVADREIYFLNETLVRSDTSKKINSMALRSFHSEVTRSRNDE